MLCLVCLARIDDQQLLIKLNDVEKSVADCSHVSKSVEDLKLGRYPTVGQDDEAVGDREEAELIESSSSRFCLQ